MSPIYILTYYSLVTLIIDLLNQKLFNRRLLNKVLLIYLTFLILFSFKVLDHTTKYFTKFNYINQFPLALNTLIPENSTIAITEAGRIPYWNQNKNIKIIDMVGLNTVYPAKNRVNYKYINNISPDLIMYHQANLLTKELFSEFNSNVELLNNQHKNNFSPISVNTEKKVQIASIELTNFLKVNFNEYDIFIVDYASNKTYEHVYAIKSNLELKDEMEKLLKDSFNIKNKLSYYDMIKIRNEN